MAQKIQQQLQQDFVLNEIRVQISCSVGVAHYPQDGRTDLELMKLADQRMYDHKYQSCTL